MGNGEVFKESTAEKVKAAAKIVGYKPYYAKEVLMRIGLEAPDGKFILKISRKIGYTQ